MLSWYQQKRVDIYIKHYRLLKIEIMQITPKKWNVFYRITSMGTERPLYMMLARCKSKQLAVVKLTEIEDYIANDLEVHICLGGLKVIGLDKDCKYFPHEMPKNYPKY